MAAHLFNESGQMQEVDIPDIFDVLEGGEDESAVKVCRFIFYAYFMPLRKESTLITIAMWAKEFQKVADFLPGSLIH